jgi:hypothetical protein
VHVGTTTSGAGVTRRVAWVETVIPLQLEARELADGLGSKYLRNEVGEDEDRPGDRPRDLPESLTQREILKIYRDEMLHYGETILGMWGDGMDSVRRDACAEWLMAVILDAFPAMKGYEQ